MTDYQRSSQESSDIPERYPAAAMDQFMFLMRAVHDCQSRCVITFGGELDADRLAEAVRLTIDAEPILGSRFIEHPWRPYWQRCSDLDTASSFSLTKPDNPGDELIEFMAMPMDPFASPQVRTCLFRSDGDVLCVKINHMVADAGSILQYVRLLADTYRKLRTDPRYHPDIRPWRSRELGQVLNHAGIIPLLRSCTHFFYPRSAWGFPRRCDDLSARAFSVRRISTEHYTGIRDYSRRHHVSVNDVMLAAFYRAMFRLLDPPVDVPLPVEVTIDLRRHLPSNWDEVLCNLSAAYFPALTHKPDATFEQTLADVRTIAVTARDNSPWLAQALYLRLAFLCGFSPVRRIVTHAIERDVASGKLHPFYANIGIISKKQVNFGEVNVTDVATFGPVPYPPACIFSFNSFADAMVLTTGYCTTATETDTVNRLLDMVVSELPE